MATSTLTPPRTLTLVFVIQGRDGQPAPDAEVRIETDLSGMETVRGRSDAQGEFSWRPPLLKGKEPVRFCVSVELPGFLHARGEFSLSPFGTPIQTELRFEITDNVARVFLDLRYDPPRMAEAPPLKAEALEPAAEEAMIEAIEEAAAAEAAEELAAPEPVAEEAMMEAIEDLALEGGAAGESAEEPAAPAPAPPPAAAYEPRVLRQPTAATEVKRAYATVRVFYATDRKAVAGASPGESFGKERNSDGALQYGICEVSIPRDHRMAHLERPFLWKLEFHEDPRKHVMVLSAGPRSRDQFFTDLSHTVERSSEKSVFVYIHGFNVDFGDATRRAAQLAYDLGFDGAPVVYSWPSRGEVVPLAYTADEASVQWTTPHLKQFLQELAQKSKATTIHLIAHSMGNRALTDALQLLFAENRSAPPRLFHQIVLTAPDIDIGVFRQLAGAIQACGQRVTLYASSEDLALEVSHRVHGVQRAGDSDPDVVVVPGIDTVDVSAVDTSLLGHSYFGENRSVITDLFNLLRNGLSPDRRPGLRPKSNSAGTYWIFQS